MTPLLVIDGDSFTHRAYHALPKSMRREDGGPSNALIGVTNMLLRLWQDERPRNVLVAWDTLDVPTYRHQALEAYQSGRVFDDELLEQLDLLPALVESAGFASAKAPGYEADDFLAAAATERGGSRRVGAGGDVGSRRVPARDGPCHRSPACARSPAGSDRHERGSRALRGRSRAGTGLHRAPWRPLGQDSGRTGHRSEARRRAARAVRIARRLARGRKVRQRGGCAPAVPPHRDDGLAMRRCPRSRTCHRTGRRRRRTRSSSELRGSHAASRRRSLGRDQPSGLRPAPRARDRRERRASRPIAVPSRALSRLRPWRVGLAEPDRARPLRRVRRRNRGHLERDLARPGHVCDRDDVGGRAASPRDARSRPSNGRVLHWFGHRVITRSMPLRWASASSATSPSQPGTLRTHSASSVSRSSTSTSITETEPRRCSRDDPTVLTVSLHQWPFWPGTGGPGSSSDGVVNVPLAAGSGDDEYRTAFEEAVEPAVSAFAPDIVLVAAGFDAHRDDPLAEMEVSSDGFRELARRSCCPRTSHGCRARGRLQPRHAPGSRPGRAGRIREEPRRPEPTRAARAPRAATRHRAS